MSKEKREKRSVSNFVNDGVYGSGGKSKFWKIFSAYATLLIIAFGVLTLLHSTTKQTRPLNINSFGGLWRPSSELSSENNNTRTFTTNWRNLLVEESSNYTTTVLSLLSANATMSSECYNSSTNSTTLEGLPESVDGKISFQTDTLYRLTLVAYDENGEKRCAGGDYYEVDFHDTERLHYLSRLPTTDLGNGSYSVDLIVPSRFAGAFTLDIYLLYSNWHGMELETSTWAKKELVVTQELDMVLSEEHLNPDPKAPRKAAIEQCTPADFDRTTWQGRWTRSWFATSCEADEWSKRYLCLPEEHYDCEEPWCFGPVGRLESNGWEYSAHCSFKIFTREEAWSCLDGRWFMMWGDSNFQDTVRNLVLFILEWKLPSTVTLADYQLPRTYEMGFTNSYNYSQLFRVSSVFNGGHWEHGNGEGLRSLTEHPDHRYLVTAHFSGTKWPDTIIINSGLHDGTAFSTIEEFAEAVDYMIDFWMKIYISLPADRKPTLIWRATIAPAGYSRGMPANPMKMEMFNQVVAEKLQKVHDRVPVKIVDAFDLTFPFHYYNNHSDGGHYGRAPGVDLPPWFRTPHWYFVDVMLAHILLNTICPSP